MVARGNQRVEPGGALTQNGSGSLEKLHKDGSERQRPAAVYSHVSTHGGLFLTHIKPNTRVLFTWGEEGGGRGLQFPGAPVLSLRACRDAAGPWGTGAWGQNRGRRVPGCNDVPRTQQLQVREDVNEVSHTRVAVDPGPQDTGRALLGALTQPQLCLVAHDQGR